MSVPTPPMSQRHVGCRPHGPTFVPPSGIVRTTLSVRYTVHHPVVGTPGPLSHTPSASSSEESPEDLSDGRDDHSSLRVSFVPGPNEGCESPSTSDRQYTGPLDRSRTPILTLALCLRETLLNGVYVTLNPVSKLETS